MWAFWEKSSSIARILTCVLTLTPLYYLSYKLRPSFSNSQQPNLLRNPLIRAEWQAQWLDTDLLGPFDPLAIQIKCNETKWSPDLVLNLAGANGGVGNIRAEILDFLFYAIEAGASIVLPNMAVRRLDYLFDVWGAGTANFSNMFDEDWFRESIGQACPQMRLYDSVEELGSEWRHEEQMYDPRAPTTRRFSTKEAWTEQTKSWLGDHNVTNQGPTIVNIEHTMWETDTRGERPEFRFALGKLLRIRADVRKYTAAVMFNMMQTQGLDLRPTDRVHQQAFYGAHLRTESDVIPAGWLEPPSELEIGLNFTAQTTYYMDAAIAYNLRTIFAASGNASEIDHFKQVAAAHRPPLLVLSKWDLLSTLESEELRAMHWDQQALVDYEILKRCSVFGGMAKSSFAFMIATARSAFMEQEGLVQDPWFAPHVDSMVAFENKLSKIWGRNELGEARVPKGAWP